MYSPKAVFLLMLGGSILVGWLERGIGTAQLSLYMWLLILLSDIVHCNKCSN